MSDKLRKMYSNMYKKDKIEDKRKTVPNIGTSEICYTN